MATSGEYGRIPEPSATKNAAIETPAAISIEPNPTGLTAYNMPRRNSGRCGEIFSRYLLMAMSEATATTQAMPQLA